MAFAERVAIRKGRALVAMAFHTHIVRGGALHAHFALRGGDWVAGGARVRSDRQRGRDRAFASRRRCPCKAAGSRTHKYVYVHTLSGRQNLPGEIT
jgi:hypothetical protein